MFWSVGWPLLRAEGFFYNLDRLYGGLGTGKLQFLIKKKIYKKISVVIFILFLVIKALDPDWSPASNSGSGSGKNVYGLRIHNPEWNHLKKIYLWYGSTQIYSISLILLCNFCEEISTGIERSTYLFKVCKGIGTVLYISFTFIYTRNFLKIPPKLKSENQGMFEAWLANYNCPEPDFLFWIFSKPKIQGCGSAFISSGSGSSILGWIPIQIRIQSGSRAFMTKNWKKLQLKKKLGDQKLQFTYPWASIKNVQVTEEVFNSQKRPSNTSKHEIF